MVRDTIGAGVADAEVLIQRDGDKTKAGVSGRTDAAGRLKFRLPAGTYNAEVRALGRAAEKLVLKSGEQTIEIPAAGKVTAQITDDKGGPIPCKVEFRGRDGTKDPHFGPQSGEHALHNLYYSHNGQFSQILPPGKYEVIVSHGPEYDALFLPIEIQLGLSIRRSTPY